MNHPQNFMAWDNPGTALITGASTGLGAEFARQLAGQGFKTVLVARRKNKLEALAETLLNAGAGPTEILTADLTNPADNERVMSRISEIDDLDVLVNNAGFGVNEDFFQADLNWHVDMINVHCTAPVQFCHTAIPVMKTRGRGVIINLSSVAALIKASMSVMYSPSKEFLHLFSQTLQANLKDTGVRVQSLCPGFTYTEFHDVDSMKGFDRNWFPENWWMTAEEVVTISLDAFRNDAVICVPGDFNREMVNDYLKTVRDLTTSEIK